MSDMLSIMIVSSETETAGVFRKMSEVEVSLVNIHDDSWPEQLRKETPDILAVELSPKADMAAALGKIERLKAEFPGLAIFAQSSSKAPELIISSMRAGAQEFFARPINEHELSQAIERVRKRNDSIVGRGNNGKLITVFSKVGGNGVTTLAVNLGIALAQVSNQRTALLELNLQHGDATSVLNLKPQYSILDACDSGDRVSSDKLQSCMTHHDSGLSLLSEPPHPAASEEISASQIQQILLQLRSTYHYVIVDTPHVFEPRSMAAMDLSDMVLVVMVATVTSTRATKKTLQVFRELGYSPDKIRLVVNRVGRADRINPQELRETLNYPTFWTIPNNYRSVIDAINSGVPLTAQKRLSNVAKNIIELAEMVDRINFGEQTKVKKVVNV